MDQEISSKLRNIAKNEGVIFAKLAKDEKCFVGNMKKVDLDGVEELSEQVLKITATEFKSRCPTTAFLLITVSQLCAKIYISVPDNITHFTEQDWLKNISMDSYVKELQDGEYLKFRDLIITESFDFLKTMNLIDEIEDEVYYTFDD